MCTGTSDRAASPGQRQSLTDLIGASIAIVGAVVIIGFAPKQR
jgi:hypothetical protein